MSTCQSIQRLRAIGLCASVFVNGHGWAGAQSAQNCAATREPWRHYCGTHNRKTTMPRTPLQHNVRSAIQPSTIPRINVHLGSTVLFICALLAPVRDYFFFVNCDLKIKHIFLAKGCQLIQRCFFPMPTLLASSGESAVPLSFNTHS